MSRAIFHRRITGLALLPKDVTRVAFVAGNIIVRGAVFDIGGALHATHFEMVVGDACSTSRISISGAESDVVEQTTLGV